jgi:hypothetical protein
MSSLFESYEGKPYSHLISFAVVISLEKLFSDHIIGKELDHLISRIIM